MISVCDPCDKLICDWEREVSERMLLFCVKLCAADEGAWMGVAERFSATSMTESRMAREGAEEGGAGGRAGGSIGLTEVLLTLFSSIWVSSCGNTRVGGGRREKRVASFLNQSTFCVDAGARCVELAADVCELICEREDAEGVVSR